MLRIFFFYKYMLCKIWLVHSFRMMVIFFFRECRLFFFCLLSVRGSCSFHLVCQQIMKTSRQSESEHGTIVEGEVMLSVRTKIENIAKKLKNYGQHFMKGWFAVQSPWWWLKQSSFNFHGRLNSAGFFPLWSGNSDGIFNQRFSTRPWWVRNSIGVPP